MSNALHDYAKLFEKYAAANGGWGVILAGEDCLSLANEMMIDADALEAENAKLREFVLTLAFCANDEADCDQCPMNGVRCGVVQQYFCDGAAETLRELGIEVDE